MLTRKREKIMWPYVGYVPLLLVLVYFIFDGRCLRREKAACQMLVIDVQGENRQEREANSVLRKVINDQRLLVERCQLGWHRTGGPTLAETSGILPAFAPPPPQATGPIRKTRLSHIIQDPISIEMFMSTQPDLPAVQADSEQPADPCDDLLSNKIIWLPSANSELAPI